MMCFSRGQTLSAQGDAADALFVIQNGRVKLRVKSRAGKEAILAILSDADLVGNDCLAGQSRRNASAIALTECNVLRITKQVMKLALKRQVKLANTFWAYVLARNIRFQQDLIDQHCSACEKRLARILLLLAHFDGHGATETTVPKLSHETLAQMVGTTRSRICFFMNRFKDSGFIDCKHKGLVRVHRTLLAFCGQ
jgi:CRP/FNR family transcriptional regulator, cyclic AMP receptor protein